MGGPRLRPPCSSTIEWGLATFTAVLRAVLQKHFPSSPILLAKITWLPRAQDMERGTVGSAAVREADGRASGVPRSVLRGLRIVRPACNCCSLFSPKKCSIL